MGAHRKKKIIVSKKPTAIPPGYRSITPYLFVNEAMKVIEFLKKAFDADEEMRMEMPGAASSVMRN